LSLSLALAPNFTPFALALKIPSSYLSLRISVSNSAIEANTLKRNLPTGVDVHNEILTDGDAYKLVTEIRACGLLSHFK
jgi:hypothetical protein